jgi:hypothetical protein
VKYSITCDESNNGFKEEMLEVVNADFRFEGVKGRFYRVEFKPVEGTSFAELRRNLFTRLAEVLEPFSGQQIADEIEALRVNYGRDYTHS